MLTWDDIPLKDQAGAVTGMSYKTVIPHWGEASIHPHPQHPGEMYLDCPSLGVNMYRLGRVEGVEETLDMINPAEMVLMRALEQRGVWCLEALVAIGGPED